MHCSAREALPVHRFAWGALPVHRNAMQDRTGRAPKQSDAKFLSHHVGLSLRKGRVAFEPQAYSIGGQGLL
jgi:hypothetical protein